MNTKLTLKLNRTSIENAKEYAKKHNISLSSLVENYFNLIGNKSFQTEALREIEITPTVLELSGIIKVKSEYDLKEDYGKHLLEKYS